MKKFLSLILCVILAAGAFTACSKNTVKSDVQLKITYDSHYSETNESTLRAYEKLCEAVINGDSEVKLNTRLSEKITALFYTGFPLYQLVSSINFTQDNDGFSIEYVNSPEEHKALVEQFSDKVHEIVTECGYGSTTINQYIFNVYEYVCNNVTLDNSVTSAYDTIMQGKGISASINSMFEYLLLQGGCEACHVLNLTDGGKIISLVKFNGSWYYFNPAAEIENGSNRLRFFAMNEDRAGKDYTFSDNEKVFAVTDDSYSQLQSALSYTVSDKDVNVLCVDDIEFSFKLN